MDGFRHCDCRLGRIAERPDLDGHAGLQRIVHAVEESLRGEGYFVIEFVRDPCRSVQQRFVLVDFHAAVGIRSLHGEFNRLAVAILLLVRDQRYAGLLHLEGGRDRFRIIARRGEGHDDIVGAVDRQQRFGNGVFHISAGLIVAILIIVDGYRRPTRVHAGVIPSLAGIIHAEHGVKAVPNDLRHSHLRGYGVAVGYDGEFRLITLQERAVVISEHRLGVDRIFAGLAVIDGEISPAVFIQFKVGDVALIVTPVIAAIEEPHLVRALCRDMDVVILVDQIAVALIQRRADLPYGDP